MSFSSLPRAGSALTAAALAATLVGCGGSEPLGPDKTVALIEISPSSAQLYSVGQQVTFSAAITTEAGTSGSGIEIGYVARDKSLLEVNSAGVAKALKKGGSTYVVATAGGKSDSALVEVPLTTCGTVAPRTLAIGEVATDIGETGFCSAASTGEYTVIVHNNSLATSGTSTVEVTGIALSTPPTSAGASFSKAGTGAFSLADRMNRSLRRDVAAEMRHRRNEAADAAPFAATALSWYSSRKNRASFAAAPPAVGDAMTINLAINGPTGCGTSSADRLDVATRVAAVSNLAIVLADTRNPAGGYTDEEYNAFAQMFDSVVNPLAVANFGAPTDIDANGRVLLVFTKAINERSPAGSNDFVSGLTHSRDLLPKSGSGTSPVCAGSNEAEMFYLLVPDPNGTVARPFTKEFVTSVTDATIIHEFQHLINFARRRYILPSTKPNVAASEELWLNEGLSHMAEELLYYRRTGHATRSNVGAAQIFASQNAFEQFAFYMAGDFLAYDAYTLDPALTSPFESGDDVATRGATWAFLRYAADHAGPSDGSLWFNLVNSGEAGLTNLQNRLGATPSVLSGMLRDFTIAVYADDYVTGIPAKYTHPSWNMRSVYPGLAQPFLWELPVKALNDQEVRISPIQAGGFVVFRFKGLPGADSFIRQKGFTGTALPAGIKMSVIRTK